MVRAEHLLIADECGVETRSHTHTPPAPDRSYSSDACKKSSVCKFPLSLPNKCMQHSPWLLEQRGWIQLAREEDCSRYGHEYRYALYLSGDDAFELMNDGRRPDHKSGKLSEWCSRDVASTVSTTTSLKQASWPHCGTNRKIPNRSMYRYM